MNKVCWFCGHETMEAHTFTGGQQGGLCSNCKATWMPPLAPIVNPPLIEISHCILTNKDSLAALHNQRIVTPSCDSSV